MALGVIFFIFGVAYNYPFITNLVFAIGIIVANVPEGLLATVTVSLALTAKRMADKMVLVKNLESVETLGSTSCICSDKTGTLTQNRMTVSNMFYSGESTDCSINLDSYNQDYEKADSKEKNSVNVPQYITNRLRDCTPDNVEIDENFKSLVFTIVLGTYTTFQYGPSEDECKTLKAKKMGVPVANLENETLSKDEIDELSAALKVAEKKMKLIHRHCKGDASETGLVQFSHAIFDLEETRNKYPTHNYQKAGKNIECAIPFSSDIKFNAFIRDMGKMESNEPLDKGLWVIIKGAPERIIGRCSKFLNNGEEIEFTDDLKQKVNDANTKYGGSGERVLAFARYRLPIEDFPRDYEFDMQGWKNWGVKVDSKFENYKDIKGSFPMHDLCLIGVTSLNDPPRTNVDLSVNKCRAAGIKVIMVTGDQPATAAAIAHKVNILKDPAMEYNTLKLDPKYEGRPQDAFNDSTGVVVHGDELAAKHLAEEGKDDLDPEKGRYLVDWISKKEVVFARTTPSQKLLIVNACQKAGHVVAVTGDGVNDSPAIKKADIGIAMGSGSDVAKNAADMILLDDNFSSIVNGVEEGRLIFDNLKKSIAYTLQSNIPEITPFIFFIIF